MALPIRSLEAYGIGKAGGTTWFIAGFKRVGHGVQVPRSLHQGENRNPEAYLWPTGVSAHYHYGGSIRIMVLGTYSSWCW